MTSLTILDVGHGNSAVLRSETDALVIDAGPGVFLLEYLMEQGINEISSVLISHADVDHLKGLLALLASKVVSIGHIYVNTDSAKDTLTWKALAFELEHQQEAGEIQFSVQLTRGQEIGFEGGATIEVLAPRGALAVLGPGSSDDDGQKIRSNSMSAVVRATLEDGPSVLLSGDIDVLGLKHVRNSGQQIQADVLVFPHHGGHVAPASSEGTNRQFTTDLLGMTEPSRIVFSNARGHQAATPRPEIVETIRSGENPPSIMCTQLSALCAASLPEVEPTHLAGSFSAGRSKNVCCAGTVSFAGPGSAPAAEAHAEFVDEFAPTALCRV